MISKARFSARQILAAGFALIILSGALLLMLPLASRNGASIPFLNALFTATSATCVTGLVVYDTWTQFSLFGQAIILLLIQIGGLGFMTFAILFAMALGKRIGLTERGYLMEAVSASQLGGIVRLAKHILLGTLFLKVWVQFCSSAGFGRALVWLMASGLVSSIPFLPFAMPVLI